MRLLSCNLPSNHNIFLFGCTHEGATLRSARGWNVLLNAINSPYEECSNNSWVDMGDQIEAIMVDDKRSDEDKLKEALPLAQRKMAIKNREPIKSKGLAVLDGNHTRKLWRFGNLAKEIADELEVEYGTWTCKLSIRDKNDNLMYKIFATHGRKTIGSTADDSIRRIANQELQLKRHLKFKAGDCAVMVKGHTHKLIVSPPRFELFLTDDGKKIKQNYTSWGQNEEYIHPDARWYGNTGSFLTLYGQDTSGYAEIAEYDPVELGFLVLVVRDRKIVSLNPYYLKL